MERKFIQCVQNENKNVTPLETIKAIKDAGFDGVFVQWYDSDWKISQQEQVDYCRELGLEIEFAHLGYQNINDIWLEGESGDALVEKFIKNLDDCNKNGIDTVVLHLCSKFVAPGPNEIGLARYQKIVDYAEKLGIKVAFENTKIFGYLEYVMDGIKNKNAGVCFDAGHCHCHFNDKFSWEKLKNRIFAVHLHENDGSGDQHLLPFDADVDWNSYLRGLNSANYIGPVTLESCYRNDYLQMTLLDFYREALKRAKKLYDIYETISK